MDDSYEVGHRFIVVVPDKNAETMREAQMAKELSEENLVAKLANSAFSFYGEHFAITLGKASCKRKDKNNNLVIRETSKYASGQLLPIVAKQCCEESQR
ncbi:hypothetical protein HX870_15070 [Pseudomonas gingeri]|uniref:hypothetical protein n=1 Tax=Pseudomonas gingeri TaxID=117681 RepID=UPI00159FAE31|nr:hypothetical protein [Pseudomonas gingeri]NWD68922.1 hypothetical protein [Pseudomonas gingeri]